MTLKQLIEYVHQHHPHMGEAEIVNRLNRYLKGVASAFKVMESSWSKTLIKDQRYYDLDTDIQDINKVFLDRVQIPRVEKPVIEDDNEPGTW